MRRVWNWASQLCAVKNEQRKESMDKMAKDQKRSKDRVPPFVVLNGNAPKGQITPIVLGTPRGGTSMLAGICRIFGFDLGQDVKAASNEDVAFIGHKGNRTMLSGPKWTKKRRQYIKGIVQYIKERNALKTSWGWKDPLASYYVRDVFGKLVNPVFLCVFRDAVGVGTREIFSNNVAADDDPGKLIQIVNAVQQHNSILEVVMNTGAPTIMISYERALRHPETVVKALAEFLNVDIDESSDLFKSAVQFIVPERGAAVIDTVLKKD